MVLLGTPAAAIASLIAVNRAADRGWAVTALVLSMLEVLGILAAVGCAVAGIV